MKTGLIGYTGFVGGNLLQQAPFDATFNSSNIAEVSGKEFDLLVCAGAPAEKWKINQEPEADLANLQTIKDALIGAKIKKLVLVSTVDVYKDPNGVTEDTLPDLEDLHPYGLHRYELEQFCRENFDTLVVRLPGLFGDGIKKNVIFDLLTGNTPFLEQANTSSEYQYYDLSGIWKDIQIALEAGVDTVNFATEPVSTEEVARHAFGKEFVNHPEGKDAVRYDFRTKHDTLYGGHDGYIYDKAQVLDALKEFVSRWRNQNTN